MKDLSTYFYDSIYESICALDDLDEIINYYGNPQECTIRNYFASQICDGKLYDHTQVFSEETYLCDIEDYENEFQDQLKAAFNDWIAGEIDAADEDELLKSILLKAQNKMGLDFSHTCPKIDKAISEAKDTIIDYLKDYIADLCPYITDEKASELSKDWGTDLYDKISDGFEATRETNEDMRKQADYQIEKLESEIDDLNSEIKELESQLDAVS